MPWRTHQKNDELFVECFWKMQLTDMCHRFVSFDVENFDIGSFLRWCFGVESHVILKSLRWLIVFVLLVVVHILLLAALAVGEHMGLDL